MLYEHTKLGLFIHNGQKPKENLREIETTAIDKTVQRKFETSHAGDSRSQEKFLCLMIIKSHLLVVSYVLTIALPCNSTNSVTKHAPRYSDGIPGIYGAAPMKVYEPKPIFKDDQVPMKVDDPKPLLKDGLVPSTSSLTPPEFIYDQLQPRF